MIYQQGIVKRICAAACRSPSAIIANAAISAYPASNQFARWVSHPKHYKERLGMLEKPILEQILAKVQP